MALLGDLVLQTANSPGTSTFNLIAPPTGRVSWVAGCGVGAGRFYYGHDGTNWEVGNGTVTSGSPDTLSRDTVYRNSLGTTAKINFTGTVNVYNDIPSDRAFWADASGIYQAQSRRITALAAGGTAASDAIRWDQGGHIRVGTYTAASNAIIIPLPNATDEYVVNLRGCLVPTNGQLFARVSVDGGATYLSGASEYSYLLTHDYGGVNRTSGLATYLPLTAASASTYADRGTLDFDPSGRVWNATMRGSNGTTIGVTFGGGNWTTATTPTHVLIGSTTGLSSGSARLLRRQF